MLLLKLTVILSILNTIYADEPTTVIDPIIEAMNKKKLAQELLTSQSLDVKSRYNDDNLMCAEDVLCAMDPAVTGAVSEDFREKKEDESSMKEQGISMYCRCIIESDLSMQTLYEKTMDVCGDGANSHWLKDKGKTLLMNWASKRVDEGCNIVTEEKGPAPPCKFEYASKRIAQRNMLGVLGYSNELSCAWRLYGWEPPADGDGVAQTLLRHQLKPMQEQLNKQLK
tara:strand:- start:5 stop:682 length:678 start_codon:yes stop_codon:yes gene_type:complete